MSDIVENLKDAINPHRRGQATVETYDPHTRGPYPDQPPADGGESELSPPSEAQNPARAEQTDLSSTGQTGGSVSSRGLNTEEKGTAGGGTAASTRPQTAPDRSPKLASETGFGAPAGTYGPHRSRIANVLDPRVDSDRDGRPRHGLSGYGGAAAKSVQRD
ncbi:hypothetical protein VTK56DRAFT_864 [Thermocarpiscus australiensis]